MRRTTPGDLIAPGDMRREELYTSQDMAVLQAEVDQLRCRLRELDLGTGYSKTSSREPLENGQTVTSLRSERSKESKRTAATSGHSWKTAGSVNSGLFAISPFSLESVAEWVFSLASVSRNLPPQHAYERLILDLDDPRRLWLQDYFEASLKCHRISYNSDEWCPAPLLNIVKICEVRNDAVNGVYLQELASIASSRQGHRQKVPELEQAICLRTHLQGPKLNEALLFHGCKWETVFSILREGFDSRLGGTNVGSAFGIGTYFSTVASKADLYSQRWADWPHKPANCEVPENLRCMICARVALGEIYEATRSDDSLRRPPLGRDNTRCDSLVGVPRDRGGCVDYDEFVIFKPGQAVPQFVIEYEHLPECQCRFCGSWD